MVTMDAEHTTLEALSLTREDDRQYCYVHPTVETGLACTQCGRPICVRCMKQALVGQFCKDCAQRRQPAQYNVTVAHLFIGAGTAVVSGFGLAAMAMVIILLLPVYWVLFILLLAAPAANLNVNILDMVSRRRRGKRFQITIGVAIATGALPVIASGLPLALTIQTLVLAIFVAVVIYRTMYSLR